MKSFKGVCESGGTSVALHQETKGGQCPCYDEQTATKSLQWHRENPDAPACGPDGYFTANISVITFKAFVEPASRKSMQIIQKVFGELHAHDMYYIGPPDVDVRGLDRLRDFLIYDGQKYEVLNPEHYPFRDQTHHYEAGLRRRD
jgi:hypothetical protein